MENEPEYRAAYFTLNPLSKAGGLRNAPRLTVSRNTAGDADTARRIRLMLDLDPARPAGTNATGGEKQSAREQAEAVRHYLTGRGWPSPLLADSSNASVKSLEELWKRTTL